MEIKKKRNKQVIPDKFNPFVKRRAVDDLSVQNQTTKKCPENWFNFKQ